MGQAEHDTSDVIRRVTFRASLDDAVDVHLRLLRRSGVGRLARRFEPLILGLVVAVATVVALSLSTVASLLACIAVVTIGTALWGPVNDVVSRAIVKRRVRRYQREQYGSDDFVCEIELRPGTVWVRQRNTELAFDWQNAESVQDTTGGIAIGFHGGIVVARDRAFATPAERLAFLEAARTLAAKSG